MSILDDVIGGLKRATRYEDYIASLCPFHDDSKPSFIVHEDRYNCYSCGANGTTKSLVKKLSNSVILREEKAVFHNPFTEWLRHETLGEVLRTGWKMLKQRPSSYMRDRGIPYNKQLELGLGMRDGWITFPIRNNNNKITGAVARAAYPIEAPKYVMPKGQNPNLPYVPSWELVNSHKTIFLTFGIIDAVTLTLYNQAAMSTTNGKHIQPQALQDIRKVILIAPDLGEELEALELAKQLDWRGKVIRMNYPIGCKDINDVHMLDKNLITRGLEEIYGLAKRE